MNFLAVIVVLYLGVLLWFQVKLKLKGRRLPPGPYPLPIVGNLFQMGRRPDQIFEQLSKKYGPLMSIRLGSLLNVVVSSPEMAKEVSTQQGFSGRHVTVGSQSHDHNKFSIGLLPVADNKWKAMRRICKDHLFRNQSLEQSKRIRHQKLQQLLGYVQKCCDSGQAVNISEAAFITTLNLMSVTLFSSDAAEFDSKATSQLKEIIEGFSTTFSLPSYAEYFPILKPFDPNGVRRGADIYFGRLLRVMKDQLDRRLESRRENPNAPKPNDFLETLVDISLGTDYNLTHNDIIHLLSDLYVGGTETTMASLEWVMTELLLHPDIFSKVTQEVRNVGRDRKIIEDADISNLPYLQAVIKEVFRYHPPGPFLLPRKADEDKEINGYFIPKGTQIIINMWAISRDPIVWPNPECFDPDRFLNNNIDYKGQYFQLIPFGSGKRICPGIPLAHRILHTAVATLIHNFDWKFAAGECNNRELLRGIALRREAPLVAIPVKP